MFRNRKGGRELSSRELRCVSEDIWYGGKRQENALLALP